MKRTLALVLAIMLMGLLISCDKGSSGSGGSTTTASGGDTTYNLRGKWRVEIEVGPWSCTTGTFGGSILVGVISFDEKGRIVGTPVFNLRLPWGNYPLWFNGFDATTWDHQPFYYTKNGVYRGLKLAMAAVTDHYPAGQSTTRLGILLETVITKIKFVNQDQLRGYCSLGQATVLGNPVQNACNRSNANALITLYRR